MEKPDQIRHERSEWWSLSGSNRRPPACKAGALPAELKPHWVRSNRRPQPSQFNAQVARARPPAAKRGRTNQQKRPGPTKSVSLSASNRHHGATDVVGPGRFELPTSPLSGVRSNQLSYGPEPLRFEIPTSRPAFPATRRRRTRPVRQFIQGRKRNEGGGACLTTKPPRRPHGACMHDAALTDWRLGSKTVQYGCPIDPARRQNHRMP